ncbi:MAG: hypothetical protein JWM80_833 [Cyanobacteria bacterium RYN_339]|nr:hypothetical protein [Cyanobacteria bacterium RYN_339]
MSAMVVLAIASAAHATATSRADRVYPYSFAHYDCAPWDGPAIGLVLRKAATPLVTFQTLPPDTYPQVVVTLYMRHPPVNSWIALPGLGMKEGGGYLNECLQRGHCANKQGRIKFVRASDNHLDGELRIQAEGTGREIVLPFAAPILPFQAICG